MIKQYDFNELAGCVTMVTCRATGYMVGLYNSEQAGLDSSDGGKWSTVCEEHGHVVTHNTLAQARSWLHHPTGWCETCMAEFQEGGVGSKESSMNKHTRGPWHTAPLAKGYGIYDAQGTPIAKVVGAYGVAQERKLADAKLIAAAPQLLAAVELAVRLLRKYGDQEAMGGMRRDLTDCFEMTPIFSALDDAKGNS